MESNSNDKLATEKVYTGLCTTMAFLCYPFLQLENVESLISLNEYTVLHNSSLADARFFEKRIHLVHRGWSPKFETGINIIIKSALFSIF